MVKQKFYTKKYLKKRLSDLLFEKNGKRPKSKSNWGDYFDEFYPTKDGYDIDDNSLGDLAVVFLLLANEIKKDFDTSSDKIIFSRMLFELGWGNDVVSHYKTFDEFIDDLFDETYLHFGLPVKH